MIIESVKTMCVEKKSPVVLDVKIRQAKCKVWLYYEMFRYMQTFRHIKNKKQWIPLSIGRLNGALIFSLIYS